MVYSPKENCGNRTDDKKVSGRRVYQSFRFSFEFLAVHGLLGHETTSIYFFSPQCRQTKESIKPSTYINRPTPPTTGPMSSSLRMHPYSATKKQVSFRNFYDQLVKFDPNDFSGRQMAYTDDFVDRMPPDSGAKKLHDEVLALHERTEELVLNQTAYWDGPGESSHFRYLVVENVPAYKDGGDHGYDLRIWLQDMLSCVQDFDPEYADESDDEEESADEKGDADPNATESEEEVATEPETQDPTKISSETLEVEGAKKYFFADRVERKRLGEGVDVLERDIKELMKRIGV